MLAPWKKSYDKPKQHIKKQRHHFANKGQSSQSCGFSSSHVWVWQLDHKESWASKNWFFWTVLLEKTLEGPSDSRVIQPVNPKGNQPCIFIGRIDAEAEDPILWPLDAKSWLIWKDPDAGKDWRLEEKGMTEDDMVGWHHQLNGHESEWTPGVGDGQGGLACCHSWGRKESELNLSLPFILFWQPQEVKMLATQSYLTLCDPMDCSSPGSSVHGILQARILEWIAISSSRVSLRLNPLKILRGMGCKTREVLLEENWEDLSHVYGVTLSSIQKAGIQSPFLVEGMKAPWDKDWWWLKRMSQFFKRCSLDIDNGNSLSSPTHNSSPSPQRCALTLGFSGPREGRAEHHQ